MKRKPAAGETPWIDPDDAPVLDEAFFARADVYEGERLVRRGRPKLPTAKRQVTLRLDPDVIERLRASGPGWQTRVNAALRSWLGAEKTS